MSIGQNLKELQAIIPEHVQLIAVSKTKPVADILEAYQAGQRVFGENKAQEMAAKHPQLPADIQWHFIGHLQTNKVKYIAPFVSLIHSVDSLKLLQEIDKEAQKNQRVIDCLLEFHIATEESKFGFDMAEAGAMLASPVFQTLNHIRLCGVMGMASFTENDALIHQEFQSLKRYFDTLKKEYFSSDDAFAEVSMGMSGDYSIAIGEGSTMVRVGTAIFGKR